MSDAKLQQFFEAIEILLHPCTGKNIGILQKGFVKTEFYNYFQTKLISLYMLV